MENDALTILLVEDDPDDTELIRAALSRAELRYSLHHVSDGEGAISYLSGAGDYANRNTFPLPSVLLLDLKMPRKSGFEVLRWVRANPAFATLPVIVLTSSDEPGDIKRAYELGATSYLTKSASFKNVVEIFTTLAPPWK